MSQIAVSVPVYAGVGDYSGLYVYGIGHSVCVKIIDDVVPASDAHVCTDKFDLSGACDDGVNAQCLARRRIEVLQRFNVVGALFEQIVVAAYFVEQRVDVVVCYVNSLDSPTAGEPDRFQNYPPRFQGQSAVCFLCPALV